VPLTSGGVQPQFSLAHSLTAARFAHEFVVSQSTIVPQHFADAHALQESASGSAHSALAAHAPVEQSGAKSADGQLAV
jgi:hypothetical protein